MNKFYNMSLNVMEKHTFKESLLDTVVLYFSARRTVSVDIGIKSHLASTAQFSPHNTKAYLSPYTPCNITGTPAIKKNNSVMYCAQAKGISFY